MRIDLRIVLDTDKDLPPDVTFQADRVGSAAEAQRVVVIAAWVSNLLDEISPVSGANWEASVEEVVVEEQDKASVRRAEEAKEDAHPEEWIDEDGGVHPVAVKTTRVQPRQPWGSSRT